MTDPRSRYKFLEVSWPDVIVKTSVGQPSTKEPAHKERKSQGWIFQDWKTIIRDERSPMSGLFSRYLSEISSYRLGIYHM